MQKKVVRMLQKAQTRILSIQRNQQIKAFENELVEMMTMMTKRKCKRSLG